MPEFEFQAEGLTEDQLERSGRRDRRSRSYRNGPQSSGISKISIGSVSTAAAFKTMVVLVALYLISHPAPRIDPAQVRVDLPPGATSTDKVIKVRVADRVFQVSGTVADTKTKTIKLIENGRDRTVPVDQNGKFLERVALLTGSNRIQLTAGQFASKTINVTADIPQADIWTQLTWDGPGDIDLHLVLPNGQDCFYSTCEKPKVLDGAQLDFDNQVSYGPEHITMDHASPGHYVIRIVYYWADNPPRVVRWHLIVLLENGRIERRLTGTLDTVGRDEPVCSFDFSDSGQATIGCK